MDIFSSVEIELPRDLTLLTRFYNELMKPNFPIDSELEPLEAWIEQLSGKGRSNNSNSNSNNQAVTGKSFRRCTLNVIVVFDQRDVERKNLLGGIVFEYYYPSNTVLITYLVISAQSRGQGTGVYLGMKAWVVMRKLCAAAGFPTPYVVFCEANNPELISDSDDAFSPVARLKAFQTMGVRQMADFQYIQPPLEEGKDSARDMLLAVVVAPFMDRDDNGNFYVKSENIKNFLTDFYMELEVPDLSKDPDYSAMISSLQHRDRVYLKDFDLSKFKQKPKKSAVESVAKAVGSVPVHIVVIGAGLSGLSCARELQRAGFSVEIVEARHRLGGRVYTNRVFDVYVDLGASWLHGTENNPLADYVTEQLPGLKLFKNNEQNLALYDCEGKSIEQELIFESYMKFLALQEALSAQYAEIFPKQQEAKEYPSDKSLNPIINPDSPYSPANLPTKPWIPSAEQQVCGISVQRAIEEVYKSNSNFHCATVTEKVLLNHFFSQIESLQNGDMRQLNVKDYDFGDEFEGGDNIVVQGYQNITMALSQGLDIKQGLEVNKIEYNHSNTNSGQPKVKLHFVKGEPIECNGVVVTVPIGVHHAKTISYSPALPAWKSNSLAAIGAGLFNKVILLFPQVFWTKNLEYFGFNFDLNSAEKTKAFDNDLSQPHRARSNSWFVNLEPATGRPIITAMISSDLATQFERLSDKEILANIMQRLTVMFAAPGETLPSPVEYRISRWAADEHSRCSYSYLKTGCTIYDFDNAALPVENSLFFAGEHTSRHRFGYADGAYVSGLREAKRIISLYQDLVDQAKPKPIQSKL
jgi:monoamine oxidase